MAQIEGRVLVERWGTSLLEAAQKVLNGGCPFVGITTRRVPMSEMLEDSAGHLGRAIWDDRGR